MYVDGKMLIAKGTEEIYIQPNMANRHGLIAGATGTGKTITLKTLAQTFSDAGVPCFLADIKSDVSGVAVPGEPSEKLEQRFADMGVPAPAYHGCPTRFWDVFGEGGHPIRTTISEMGPTLLSRLLGLTEVQEGVLNIVFRVADDEGLLLLDLKDLRAMLAFVGENNKDYTLAYGNVSTQSIGAIQRAMLKLEDAGGDIFFGEPALDINDWLMCDEDGRGYLNVLNCVRLVQSPLLYSTFLLWMLSELYETLPEVGDPEKPKICFFFDEAHLLFTDAPKALLEKVEQVVKLIRSKGVGVYFITQNPMDIPDGVLAQLGNRIQHALRAYTPSEQRAVRAAASSFRTNPDFDTETAITELGTGEALISVLDEEGKPTVVQRAMVLAPGCSFDAADGSDVRYIIGNSPFASKYAVEEDRESAYELLLERAQRALEERQEAERAELEAKELAAAEKAAAREAEKAANRKQPKSISSKLTEAALTSMSRSLGTGVARGLLNIFKK